MTRLKEIYEQYPEDQFLSADGMHEALLGVDEQSMRLVYSVSKVIQILQDQGMSREEAMEFYGFNIECAYVGEKTPIWCNDLFFDN